MAIDTCKLVIDILAIHGNIPFVDSLLTFFLSEVLLMNNSIVISAANITRACGLASLYAAVEFKGTRQADILQKGAANVLELYLAMCPK